MKIEEEPALEIYHSPYEAYPFLCDPAEDLRCDFELLTDELASATGLLRAQVEDSALRDELLWVCELIYHLNPALRTSLSVTEEETAHLAAAARRLEARCGVCSFVLPQGCPAACTAHLLRVRAKCLVRLVYRHAEQGNAVPERLLDLCNLLSGYYFALSLALNALSGMAEVPFVSRSYR